LRTLPSATDVQAARALTDHERAWEAAYGRWDSAYRDGQRAAFLVVASSTFPALSREADAIYRSAIAVSDEGLRGQYVALARNFLTETSAIQLANYAVRKSDTLDLRRAIDELDSARRSSVTLAQNFVSYFQRRFGFNPVGASQG
jgi:hypothetical protein